MDGIISIHGSGRQAHRGYALVEALVGLALTGIAAIGRAATKVMRAQQMAKVRREMHGLSDHYLRDIGLSRNDIDGIFR